LNASGTVLEICEKAKRISKTFVICRPLKRNPNPHYVSRGHLSISANRKEIAVGQDLPIKIIKGY